MYVRYGFPPTFRRRRERRRSPRLPSTLDVFIIGPEGGGGPWAAALLNVSRGGVGLLTEPAFPVGTIVTIGFRLPGRHFQRELQVVNVIHGCIQWPNDCWQLGGSFTRELGVEELRALLDAVVVPCS